MNSPLKQLTTLLKNNQFARTALLAGGLILLLIIALSPNKDNQPLPQKNISSSPSASSRPELINLNSERLKQASAYRKEIESKLPIYLEGFQTSVGIKTTINIYLFPADPDELTHLEIYGLSYLNQDTNQFLNPNFIAYKESFQKALSLLRDKEIDPQRLIFSYSDKELVRDTATAWVDKLSLLP